MAFSEKDFEPAETGLGNRCGCHEKAYLVPCDVRYIDQNNVYTRVCFRQQCQDCGFVRKNKMGKPLYYYILDATNKDDRFTFLPEYFWAPDEYTFDENHQYSKAKKLDFMRRILTLANRNSKQWGHLAFTKEQIDSVVINKKA